MPCSLTPLVSLLFSGATLTEHDDLPAETALVGRPVWGQTQLLSNLELRLGLVTPRRAEAVRVQQWSRRMAELEAHKPGRFYARSHSVDSVGTATTVLAWRDELVAAGWNGDPVPDGGERLETLRELDAGADLPMGAADRLRRVEDELRISRAPLFDAILLAEPRVVWSGRWQRVFTLLEQSGSPVRTVRASFKSTPGDTDLAMIQALLRGDGVGARGLRGDGSLVLLRAETSWELGDATAALLRAWGEPSAAIVRGGDVRPLNHALVTHGLASQGLDGTSVWRPMLQLLPLALELAFEPRDPYRVLELLTLPVGPFRGFVGRMLAGALTEAPGIGGPAWQAAKQEVVSTIRARGIPDGDSSGDAPEEAARRAEERVAKQLAEIAEWLEQPGCDAAKPAPQAALLAVADRVRSWLQPRLAITRAAADDNPVDAGLADRADILGTAFAQAQAFHEALSHESRAALDLVDVRLLLEQISAGHTLTLDTERAGRIDPVDTPAGLRLRRKVVVWWHCVAGTEWRPPAVPWRRREVRALRDAGVPLADSARRLVADSESWHQVIHAAEDRLVLAMPHWAIGEALEPHPVWHEIVARLGATPADLARVTIDARDLLARRIAALGAAAKPPVDVLGPTALPPARNHWRLLPAYLGSAANHSATSLEALVGCPLRWVFKYPASLCGGALESLASGPLLFGKLGHRLAEELHHAGALADPTALVEMVSTSLDRLLREEAAVLLLPGMTFELAQLRDQLTRAITRLAEVIAESKLTVVDVEVRTDSPWREGALTGRIDMLLRDESGRDVILDLKWGGKRYRELLEQGLATQLAVYAATHMTVTKAAVMPVAAYFSLSRGELLATNSRPFRRASRIEGPPLEDVWFKLVRTVERVEANLLGGLVPVTGLRRSNPVLEAVGVDERERGQYLAMPNGSACRYCEYGALCGKNWEAVL